MSQRTLHLIFQGEPRTVPQGTPIGELVDPQNLAIVAAKVQNYVRDLRYGLTSDSTVTLLDVHSDEGMRVYRHSLNLVLARAVKETIPGSRLRLEHSVGNGLYGEIHFERPLVEQDVNDIGSRMAELIDEAIPIEPMRMPVDEASKLFFRQGLHDKVRLLKHSRRQVVTVHRCGWYHDILPGVGVPNTKYLKVFKLRFYLPGFILEFPKQDDPHTLPEYVEHGKLATVFYGAEKWAKNIGVADAGALNEVVKSGKMPDLIQVSEAHQEKQIGHIADRITKERDRLRVILIAGPSSSGKTTFAHRLSIQLRVNGLQPVAVSLDDYFVNREQTPLDKEGKPDFEALEAIDIQLFNEHLSKLIQGETVQLPTFNFAEGQRQWRGRTLEVSSDQPLIIEGIHGLNDKLTTAIPKGRKFKIYVSALTQINIDDHTRIPTTDLRLIRRIVRDNQFRSYRAIDTIRQWPSVRRGEEKHIFPFQEDADVLFNSALVYELAVLRAHAQSLLRQIINDQEEFWESRRLLRLLLHFSCATDYEGDIPCTSIIREFIGGSCLHR